MTGTSLSCIRLLGLVFWNLIHLEVACCLAIWPGEGFYLPDPCELTFANTLLLTNAAISLGNAFISLEISLQFYIFFSLISFIQAFSFISLQIKEFRIMGLSINDSVYSCVFFFLTGLHFFHLLLGLLLLSLLFWSCSFSFLVFISSIIHIFCSIMLYPELEIINWVWKITASISWAFHYNSRFSSRIEEIN